MISGCCTALDPARIEKARQKNGSLSAMMSRGVDGLITNQPAITRSVLVLRSKLSPVERLLMEFAGLLGVSPEIRDL